MERKPSRFRPQLDLMESRLLLSVATGDATGAPDAPPAESRSGAEVTTLADDNMATTVVYKNPSTAIAGRYSATADDRIADAPLRTKLNGAGRIAGVGPVRLAGHVNFGGFRVAGSPDVVGTIKLANAKGAMTLKVSGTGGMNPVPNGRFPVQVTVAKATGSFRALQKTGMATLQFGMDELQSSGAKRPIAGAATVTLDLKPAAL